MIPLNYHHLYYFYIIAREGTISQACEVLHLAQPTLSAQLKQFETTLKHPLFDRDKKRLILTEEGKTVFTYAKKIFDLGNEMQSIVQTGIIRDREFVHMGVVSGMPRAFSRALVSHVLKKYPHSHVNLFEASLPDLLQKLEDLSLDIILTETSVSPGEGMECESRQVGKIPIIFAASPELANIYKKKIGKHAEIPFVVPTNPPHVYSHVRDLLASGKLNPKIVAEVQDVEVARLLALEKWGIAPVNKFSLQMSKPDKGLVAVDWIFPEPIYENLYLVTRKRHYPNPIANYLLETFRL